MFVRKNGYRMVFDRTLRNDQNMVNRSLGNTRRKCSFSGVQINDRGLTD